MNFNSLQYYIFLPVSVLLYHIIPAKYRNGVLLVLSYYFYMCWQPIYALLIFTSTAITFACSILVDSSKDTGRKKLWLTLSLVINLAILFFFKYFNFAAGLITEGLTSLGLNVSAPRLDVLLPVGISFYTFQALGYTIDVYRGDKAERNFINYALFISFFPQLVAGPIERSDNILPQLKTSKKFEYRNFQEGLCLVLWGLFKKIVISDNVAVLTDTVYNDVYAFGGLPLAVGTIAFAFQIYCDFSAYSDIARGSAKMLGIELMKNFRAPYTATSIKDFWRRWHISLSTWFKDYLYIPLGGNRCSKARNYLNIMIVFTFSGLWHGASTTFIAWGAINGLYQIVSAILEPLKLKAFKLFHIDRQSSWFTFIRRVLTFILVCLAWVFFRAETIGDAIYVVRSILTMSGGTAGFSIFSLGLGHRPVIAMGLSILVLAVVDIFAQSREIPAELYEKTALRYVTYFVIIVVVVVVGYYGTAYDPQDFIYFQF